MNAINKVLRGKGKGIGKWGRMKGVGKGGWLRGGGRGKGWEKGKG